IPYYSIIGDIKNLSLDKFLDVNDKRTNLNLYFSIDGKNFNIDEMNSSLTFGIDSSIVGNKKINSSIVELKILKDENTREIKLNSDFVDFRINGEFSLSKAIDLISYESKSISKIISNKISELNPLNVIDQKQIIDTTFVTKPTSIEENLKFSYDFKFKDFELITNLIGNEKLDIAGSGKGIVENKNPNFNISTELDIEYMVLMNKGKMTYLSNFDVDFNFSRDNNSTSFDNIFGSLSLTGKRFYFGSNVKSIHADLVFNQSKLFINAGLNFDDLFTLEGDGKILMTPIEQQFIFDDLTFSYDGIDWTNNQPIVANFNPNYFKIENCELFNDTTFIFATGIIQNNGEQDLTITAKSITGKILEKYLFGIKNSSLVANGTAQAKIFGKFENPLMNISFEANDLKIENNYLGNIKGYLIYTNKNLSTNFSFLDKNKNLNKPLFVFNGNFPIDLSFSSVEERFLNNEQLSIELVSDNFNLQQLGNVIPFISNQSGNLKANIKVNGTFDNPEFEGFAHLTNGFFKTTSTNLDYKLGAKLKFEKKGILVDSLSLANAGGTNFPGEIKGLGSIVFDGFRMKDVNLRFFGDIALLSQQTQNVSPFFYGDLKISTDGDWLLTKQGDKFFFKANMLMDKTDLYYTTGRNEAASTNKNFDFVYVVDSSKIDKEIIRFQNVLTLENAQKKISTYSNNNFNLDYEIGLRSGKDGRLTFILGQALNQKLIVNLSGSMRYENINNVSRAQGTFELLQGSKLEFFKTFDAVGFLRFEGDVTNPYLDITATYNSNYINPRDEKQEVQDVAIKINIRGPLSDLGKNLSSDQNALSVYVGARNIQNNIRESKYDYADAFSFILIGKFKDDLTAQDKAIVAGQTQDAIGSTATSFLGTVLTNFVNSQVGDLINNISINSSGDQTKFSLSGRIENFSYTIGGTTETFTNLSKANLMLEYRFYPTNLKARLERKDPIIKTFGLDDKILEMALKYKFEF
ncbi:MAG: translocation/assembly module TamB, partial [Melioribacteraceae bacterium]|nr:translocation/assembly module TamB [Melioribacteraceae bacterium]